MNQDQLISVITRVGFFGASAFMSVAFIELVVRFFGYTILQQTYKPGRLLEFAAIFLIFVIALLLRQVRDALKERGAAR